jgi:SAM-dependent methyltransferase
VSHSVGWYDDHATDLIRQYEAIDPAKLYRWLLGLIPEARGTVLDIGAGTGRDAAWFAGQGHDVVAVEPSSRMRAEGQHIHTDPRIRWIDDQLPELGILGRLGISFDLVMLNAVWQHVAPSDRERAFRKVAGLVKSGGLLVITLRLGPAPADRGMHPVSLDEVERLARNRGFEIEKVHLAPDEQGRADVSWTCIALRLPDDGTGALPLLQKSATYKLGLLRTLCRAAAALLEWCRTWTTGSCVFPLVSSRSTGCGSTCLWSERSCRKRQPMSELAGLASRRMHL